MVPAAGDVGQYGAAKAALIFETERWALEFVPHGIRVNTVSPGSILVEGNGWDRYRLTKPAYFEDYVRHGFPMGRLGTAEEVADVIVFIASPRAPGSMAETFRWTVWSSRTRRSTAGRTRLSYVWAQRRISSECLSKRCAMRHYDGGPSPFLAR